MTLSSFVWIQQCSTAGHEAKKRTGNFKEYQMLQQVSQHHWLAQALHILCSLSWLPTKCKALVFKAFSGWVRSSSKMLRWLMEVNDAALQAQLSFLLKGKAHLRRTEPLQRGQSQSVESSPLEPKDHCKPRQCCT